MSASQGMPLAWGWRHGARNCASIDARNCASIERYMT